MLQKILLYIVLLTPLFFFAQTIKDVDLLDQWVDRTLPTTFDEESIYNETWGWKINGEEYAVIGSTKGTHFFRITPNDKLELIDFKLGVSFLGIIHRDYHTYQHYLYEVADEGSSALRIYDLQYLPDSIPIVYESNEFILRSHNIFIDTTSALLYSCGNTDNFGMNALRVLSLANPTQPTLVTNYDLVNYVHDIFVRRDTAYLFVPGDGVVVLDFSTPTMPLPLGNLPFYIDQGYTHSGWLSDDSKILVFCDENPSNRFKVCDVSDLSDIKVLAAEKPPTFVNTIPHNVMVKGRYAYFSYYADGLQIYDLKDPANPKRVAYYDTYDSPDNSDYRGAWGIYALLPSERLLVSDRKNGLFLLRHTPPPPIAESNVGGHGIYPNPAFNSAYFYYNQPVNYPYTLSVFNNLGQLIQTTEGVQDYLYLDLSKLTQGHYYYQFHSKNNDKILSGKFIKL